MAYADNFVHVPDRRGPKMNKFAQSKAWKESNAGRPPYNNNNNGGWHGQGQNQNQYQSPPHTPQSNYGGAVV